MPKTVQEILRMQYGNPNLESEHRDWIREATDEQLDEYILCVSGNRLLSPMALAERQRRHFKHLSKPHWTMTPARRF
jgi:hypothetical protein